MATDSLLPQCFLALPSTEGYSDVRDAIIEAVDQAGFQPVSLNLEVLDPRRPLERLLQADVVVADLTNLSSNVLVEVGAILGSRTRAILLWQNDQGQMPSDLNRVRWAFESLLYSTHDDGLEQLKYRLTRLLRRVLLLPRKRQLPFDPSPAFPVDWDRLDPTDAENLIRELLMQLGYQRVEWVKGARELDLIAELPRKDPDGAEHQEVWLVSMGRNAPPEVLLEMLEVEPRMYLRRLLREAPWLDKQVTQETSITLLLVLLRGDGPREWTHRLERRYRFEPTASNLRVRIWDQSHLTSLVRQYPQLAYKYFSDEGRSQSKYRKSPDELYRENVALGERQAKLIAELREERNRRIRAERDAIWKDISFAAAHKLGNPIFAIETYLDPMGRRIREKRNDEALAVIEGIRTSVEKAKGIVDQFKSLTRAQVINPVPTLLRPILEDACSPATHQGFACEIDCPQDLTIVGDPERLAECFDELVANSLHWFDKPVKVIRITVGPRPPEPLPESLDPARSYVLVRFVDNGTGVPGENKSRIFDAFFTTHDHGTGLGLALVRRIVEGHGGDIRERGVPGEGAEFEIYLPRVDEGRPPARRRATRTRTSTKRPSDA